MHVFVLILVYVCKHVFLRRLLSVGTITGLLSFVPLVVYVRWRRRRRRRRSRPGSRPQ